MYEKPRRDDEHVCWVYAYGRNDNNVKQAQQVKPNWIQRVFTLQGEFNASKSMKKLSWEVYQAKHVIPKSNCKHS